MDSERERNHVDAEAVRQEYELERQAAERARVRPSIRENRRKADDGLSLAKSVRRSRT